MSDFRQKRSFIIAFVCLAVYLITNLIQVYHRSKELSATFDEPFYLKAGLTYWQTGSNKMFMRAGTMPLPVMWSTLPLYIVEKYRDRKFNLEDNQDFGEALVIARHSMIPVWIILLCYAYALGKLWGGPLAGFVSPCLIAYEPNLLGHACLATTDIALTAGILAATYHFAANRNQNWKWRIVWPGIFYGIALLCKASALLFVPIIWYVIAMSTTPYSEWKIRTWIREFSLQFLIGLAVLFVVCGSEWKAEPTFVTWAASLNDGWLKSAMVPISENLKIFTNAGEGLAQQIKHNARGHGVYLLGKWEPRAIWYYFFVALFVKLSPFALAGIVLGALFRRKHFFGPAGWISVVLLLMTVTCRVQIGIRLVFPLVSFLLIAVAIGLSKLNYYELNDGLRKESSLKKLCRKMLLFIPVIFICGQTYLTQKIVDLLRFSNPLVCEVGEGYKWLSDSNYDWGQGLLVLEKYAEKKMDKNAGEKLKVWYFGTDPRVNSNLLQATQLHLNPDNITEAEIEKLIGNDLFAVSTTVLYGNPKLTVAGEKAIAVLKRMRVVQRYGAFIIFLANPAGNKELVAIQR